MEITLFFLFDDVIVGQQWQMLREENRALQRIVLKELTPVTLMLISPLKERPRLMRRFSFCYIFPGSSWWAGHPSSLFTSLLNCLTLNFIVTLL